MDLYKQRSFDVDFFFSFLYVILLHYRKGVVSLHLVRIVWRVYAALILQIQWFMQHLWLIRVILRSGDRTHRVFLHLTFMWFWCMCATDLSDTMMDGGSEGQQALRLPSTPSPLAPPTQTLSQSLGFSSCCSPSAAVKVMVTSRHEEDTQVPKLTLQVEAEQVGWADVKQVK